MHLASTAPAEGSDDSRSSVVDWLPAVDIEEEDKQFVLRADLPGVESKDIDITMEKGVLTLRGVRSTETRDEKSGYRRVERVSGEFADSQAIKARHVNGVLEVVIPKQDAVLPRKISVASNQAHGRRAELSARRFCPPEGVLVKSRSRPATR